MTDIPKKKRYIAFDADIQVDEERMKSVYEKDGVIRQLERKIASTEEKLAAKRAKADEQKREIKREVNAITAEIVALQNRRRGKTTSIRRIDDQLKRCYEANFITTLRGRITSRKYQLNKAEERIVASRMAKELASRLNRKRPIINQPVLAAIEPGPDMPQAKHEHRQEPPVG